jgi:hypothetical protein
VSTDNGEPPPTETGPVPVHVVRVTPRLLGVPVPAGLLVLACATLVVALVLFGFGAWPTALALLVVAVGLAVLAVALARRTPESPLARAGAAATRSIGSRARALATAVRAESEARQEVAALRAELGRQSLRRDELLRELGATVYAGGDEDGEARLRSAVADVDRRTAELEAEVEAAAARAGERIERARLEVQRTQQLDALPNDRSSPDDDNGRLGR